MIKEMDFETISKIASNQGKFICADNFDNLDSLSFTDEYLNYVNYRHSECVKISEWIVRVTEDGQKAVHNIKDLLLDNGIPNNFTDEWFEFDTQLEAVSYLDAIQDADLINEFLDNGLNFQSFLN